MDAERVLLAGFAGDEQLGLAFQRAGQVVDAGDAEPDLAQRDQHAGLRCAARLAREQSAVHGHRLRAVLTQMQCAQTIAVAQGIALALDRPVLPVSTLAALAMRADAGADGDRILASIDARMGEVYLGAFSRRGDDLVALDDEVVVKPDDTTIPQGDSWHGVGTGFAAAEAALSLRLHGRLATVDAVALPHAADVARLAALAFARGEAVAAERIEPAYLRNNVALTLAEQQVLRAKG